MKKTVCNEKYKFFSKIFASAAKISGYIRLSLHIECGNVFPKPLSREEEELAFSQMSQGDSSARLKLIEHNLRLVAHIIKKYYSSANDQEELLSIGTIGLIKAVSTFNYEKGTRFATYASKCIEKATVSLRL